MTHYLLIFIAGIAGSFHCIGMCGGFACILGKASNNSINQTSTLQRHLFYNSGRLVTYMFIGGLLGSLGFVLVGQDTGSALSNGQRILALVAGVLMIAMGLQLLGYLRHMQGVMNRFGSSTVVVSLRSLLTTPGRMAPLAFGVFNGFLPCPLVYAFAAQAAATGSAVSGLMTMLAFGLGTFPAMLIMGRLGILLSPTWRQRGVWLAAGFILILGSITLLRGVVSFSTQSHFGHPL